MEEPRGYHRHESEHERHERWLRRIEAKIDTLITKENKLSIDQATFDSDLAALVGAITSLESAVDAWIASHPDLSAEDQSVQAAAQTVSDELAKLNPTQPAA
jgi:chromosome segregation ATPase